MRCGPALLCLALAGCAGVPPRFDNRKTATGAYRTFRGAVARREYEREWYSLSERFRARFGLESIIDWRDARELVLTQDHSAIKGIIRSRTDGEARRLDDGRVLLPVKVSILFITIRGQVWMRPEPVVRVVVEGRDKPVVYWRLPGIELVWDEERADVVGVRIPPDLRANRDLIAEDLAGERILGFQAQVEWFVDDFAVGDQTAESLRDEVKRAREKGE